MSRYSARLRELEKRLAPPERPPVVVLWVYDDDPPEWATEALRPHLPPADVIVEWSRCPSTGEFAAKVGAQRYEVTPDGCRPTEPAMTIRLDNPNDAGPGPMTPRLARAILRAAEEDGTLPD